MIIAVRMPAAEMPAVLAEAAPRGGLACRGERVGARSGDLRTAAGADLTGLERSRPLWGG